MASDFFPICTLLNYDDFDQIDIMPAVVDPLLGKVYQVNIDNLPSFFYKENENWVITGFAAFLPEETQKHIADTIDTLPMK